MEAEERGEEDDFAASIFVFVSLGKGGMTKVTSLTTTTQLSSSRGEEKRNMEGRETTMTVFSEREEAEN